MFSELMRILRKNDNNGGSENSWLCVTLGIHNNRLRELLKEAQQAGLVHPNVKRSKHTYWYTVAYQLQPCDIKKPRKFTGSGSHSMDSVSTRMAISRFKEINQLWRVA